jgi:hypothetical protein
MVGHTTTDWSGLQDTNYHQWLRISYDFTSYYIPTVYKVTNIHHPEEEKILE